MPPFGVTILATVPQGSEIPEGLMNNPVLLIQIIHVNDKNVEMCRTNENTQTSYTVMYIQI